MFSFNKCADCVYIVMIVRVNTFDQISRFSSVSQSQKICQLENSNLNRVFFIAHCEPCSVSSLRTVNPVVFHHCTLNPVVFHHCAL